MIISIDIGSGIANFVHKSQASIKTIQKEPETVEQSSRPDGTIKHFARHT